MWFAGDNLFAPIERRRGLPIGNLTSQWFGNWYLNDLDHFVTSRLRLGGYLRYCDDFLLAHDDPLRLRAGLRAVVHRLAEERLRLHEDKLCITPTRAGLRFVGYRIWPTHRLLPKENVRRFRRRLRWMQQAYAGSAIEWHDVKRRLDGWLGHAQQANSRRLLTRLSRDWVFCRDEPSLRARER